MLETNVVYLDRLSHLFAGRSGLKRVFSVTTDKASNPSSMMGATKRLMEHALFSPTVSCPDYSIVSSARFANVAFSNGSLLQSWQFRLDAGQPLEDGVQDPWSELRRSTGGRREPGQPDAFVLSHLHPLPEMWNLLRT